MDVLRQVLTAQNLSSFSLTDCVQSLLGQTIEASTGPSTACLACLHACMLALQNGSGHGIHLHAMPALRASCCGAAAVSQSTVCQLPSVACCWVWMQVLHPGCLAGLLGLAGPPPQQLHHQRLVPGTAAMADALRVARYALRRCDAVGSLLQRLATVPEMFEMARATGLTLGQVGVLKMCTCMHTQVFRRGGGGVYRGFNLLGTPGLLLHTFGGSMRSKRACASVCGMVAGGEPGADDSNV